MWLDQWRAASPVAEWNRGLESSPIDLENPEKRFGLVWSETAGKFEARERVVLHRSIGLAIYATELHTMTARDDVAASHCLESGIPASARMEVLITQLGLFGSEYDVDTRLQILSLALDSAASRDEADMYTSGVVLVALLEKPDVVARALRAICDARRVASAPSFGGPQRLNRDLELLAAHLIRHGIDLGDDLRHVRRLLSSADATVAELLDAFHRECCSELGTVHSSPLWRLHAHSSWSVQLVANAIDCITKLDDLVLHLRRLWSVHSAPDRPELRQARVNAPALLQHARDALQKLDSEGIPPDAARFVLRSTLEMLEELHAAEFLKLEAREVNAGTCKPPLEKAVMDLVAGIGIDDWTAAIDKKVAKGQVERERWTNGVQPVIRMSPSGDRIPDAKSREMWVVWNGTVQKCLREILMNILYSDGPTLDPGGHACDAWISVGYSQDGAGITIENSAAPAVSPNGVVDERSSELRELGVSCACIPPGPARRRFTAIIALPYAGTAAIASRALAEKESQ